MHRSVRTAVKAALALCAVLMPATQALATPITDPANDFIASYSAIAPKNGDLDVLSAEVIYDGVNFILTATFNAAVNFTPDAFYVWGFDRGQGAIRSNFANLGRPNIIFDSVVVIQNEGTGVINDLTGMSPQVAFGASATTVNGNSMTTLIPIANLPSRGFAFSDYTWNLWPRFGGLGVAGTAQISDFAPDASMQRVTTTPEPTSLVLLATGVIAVVARRRAMLG